MISTSFRFPSTSPGCCSPAWLAPGRCRAATRRPTTARPMAARAPLHAAAQLDERPERASATTAAITCSINTIRSAATGATCRGAARRAPTSSTGASSRSRCARTRRRNLLRLDRRRHAQYVRYGPTGPPPLIALYTSVYKASPVTRRASRRSRWRTASIKARPGAVRTQSGADARSGIEAISRSESVVVWAGRLLADDDGRRRRARREALSLGRLDPLEFPERLHAAGRAARRRAVGNADLVPLPLDGDPHASAGS